jgi:ribosomal-protein-alanine N-acetyltransferase
MASPVKRQDRSVLIRHGTEADVDDFVRIWQAIWRHSFARILAVEPNDPRFRMGMAHAEFIPIARDIIVATRAERVVGFAYRNLAMIEDLWVDPLVQGHGIGRGLLRNAVDAIAADGYRTASLDCLEANTRARQFYERENGGRPFGTRPGRNRSSGRSRAFGSNSMFGDRCGQIRQARLPRRDRPGCPVE